jgi:hypothetical protein
VVLLPDLARSFPVADLGARMGGLGKAIERGTQSVNRVWLSRETAMATTNPSIDVDTLRERFIEYGLQYYVAGRSAVASGLNPVAANILHHAVEMFLKAGLCAHTTEDDRRYELKHDLPKIWQAFRTQYDPEGKLARFDECVKGLHRYEDIRYPEGMMKLSVVAMRTQFGGAPLVTGDSTMLKGTTPKDFRLNMNEIDTLVRAICDAAGITIMGHLIATYREPGKTYLKKENAEAEHLF